MSKKVLLNERVKEEKLEEVAELVMYKALRIVEQKGSLYASVLIEKKDIETLKDIKQDVIIQIICDDYIVTRNAFRVVRKFIYNNYEKNNIDIFYNDEKIEIEMNKQSFEKYNKKIVNVSFMKQKNIDFNIEKIKLTEREREIINMYAKGISVSEICKNLEIKSKGTVSNTIKRVKEKIKKELEKNGKEVA